ncbi:MAG: glutaredoxin [Parasphingorhabdus sp.]|jgi:glutaredoxin
MSEKLSLYCRDWCGACYMVKRTVDKLNVEIEIRDIYKQPEFYDELVQARGRGTVPVLRKDFADGSSEWMPESRDIINFLIQHQQPA